MIGIIIAMKEEFFHVRKKIQIKKTTYIDDQEFLFFDFNKNNYVLTLSNIGKTNAAISTTLMINTFKPDYIFNFGSAGAAMNKINIFDLILVEKSFHYDVDVTNFGYELGQLPGEELYFYAENKLVSKIEKSLIKNNIKFQKGLVCSADNFITDKNIDNFPLIKKNGSLAIDMEIASIMQTCKRLKTPILSFKFITDSIFKKDAELDFKSNVKNSSYLLLKLLEAIE